MTIPVPRYNIGDTVWRGSIRHTTEQLPCPDCLGTKTWRVITPAGTEMTAECRRCGHDRMTTSAREDIPSLTVRKWEPSVEVLTIGSVRIDTANERGQVEYMCRETGVGSGSVYEERKLHPTKEEAQADAKAQADEATEEIRAQPSQLTARRLSHLTVDLAARAADWNGVYQAWAVARWHRETLDDITDQNNDGFNRSVADVKEYIETRASELSRYDFINRHPFEALLTAARTSTDATVRAVVAEIDDKLPSGDDTKRPETADTEGVI